MFINTKNILSTISSEIAEIINSNLELYSGTEVILSDEQLFYNFEQEEKPGTIYAVVKFLSASIDYGQTAIPIVIEVLCEQDRLEISRNLFYEFVKKYNLYWNENRTMEQVYEAPDISSNFNEVFEGFKSVISIPGAILLLEKGNVCTVEYYPISQIKDLKYITYRYGIEEDLTEEYDPQINFDEFKSKINSLKKDFIQDGYQYKMAYYLDNLIGGNVWKISKIKDNQEIDKIEQITNIYECGVSINDFPQERDEIVFLEDKGFYEIEFLSLNTETSVSLDSQAFYNNNGFTKSVGKFGSFSMNLTTYLFNNDFLNKCLAVYLGDVKTEPMGIDTKFNFKLSFQNGSILNKELKLASFSLQQNKGQLPLVSLTFSE